MLYYSDKRFLPSTVNMMVLQDDDSMYYYVHRSLYDQAVILSDRYTKSQGTLAETIGCNSNKNDIRTFLSTAPKPVNILGYFLALVDVELDDMEEMCGALHVISSGINLREFIKVPAAIRASVAYSLSIKEEYQMAWDRFFQEAISYDDILHPKAPQFFTQGGYAPAPYQVSAPIPVTEVVEEEDDDEDDFDWDAPIEMPSANEAALEAAQKSMFETEAPRAASEVMASIPDNGSGYSVASELKKSRRGLL